MARLWTKMGRFSLPDYQKATQPVLWYCAGTELVPYWYSVLSPLMGEYHSTT